MGDFSVLRVNNNFSVSPTDYFDVAGCENTRFSACTSNYTPQVITFYDNMFLNYSENIRGISQYTMVHEMGHRFNALSDGGGSGGQGRSAESLYGRMTCQTDDEDNTTCPTVRDFRPTDAGVVFGYSQTAYRGVYYPNWVRGKRGWGTGPHSLFNEDGYLPTPNGCTNQSQCRDQTQYITDFQQNSFSIGDWLAPPLSDDRVEEIDEAVADMFLNWVYRKVTNGDEGFKNISWLTSAGCNTSSGCDDATRRPGDARFDWIESTMSSIFTNHPEWQLGE